MKTKLIILIATIIFNFGAAQDFEITPIKITSASGRGGFSQDKSFNIISLAGLPENARFAKLSVFVSTGSKVKGNPRTSVVFYHQYDNSGSNYYVHSKAGQRSNAILIVPLNNDGTLRIKITQFGGKSLGSGGAVTILGYSL